jgi:hypothetical protein
MVKHFIEHPLFVQIEETELVCASTLSSITIYKRKTWKLKIKKING